MPAAKSVAGSFDTPEFRENIDSATFEQILEMDDDEEERDFSKSIVYDFFQQAESTFDKMAKSLEKEDLPDISALGHFLKGSSATLGMSKLKDSCEKIQHLGAGKDEAGVESLESATCLAKLKPIIAQAKVEFSSAEKALKGFYGDE